MITSCSFFYVLKKTLTLVSNMSRILSIILLSFTGVGALYGGVLLIADPTGWKIGMSTSILKYSPFTDFFFPGLILFLILGLGSLTSCALVLIRANKSSLGIIFTGFALSIWISIQILMLRDVEYLQILFACVGILLIVLGILERKREFNS